MEVEFLKSDSREEEDEDSPHYSKVVELLKAKVKLDNGEDGYVFTKTTDENSRGRFRCHVCNVPIGSSKTLEEHASGKNHCKKMQTNFHSHENFSKIVIKESSKLCTDVGGKVIKAPGVDIPDLAPGEPVPPGFEDIVTRVPEIKSTLDEMKAPLIGLEYLAEITPAADEVEPKYCCLLCNKRGDPRTVLAHLVCFNHRIKYIGRYFPRTNTALALIPKVREYKRGTGEVLAKIVKAIENKFGRLNPVIVDGAVFDEKKEEYYREMRAGRHFHETADSNYELLVDLDFIKKCAPEADTVLTIDLEKEEAKKRSTAMKNEMNRMKNKIYFADADIKSCDNKSITQTENNPKEKREKSVETISSSGSRSYSRSRSRSYSRSRSRSRSFSKSRSRPRYRYVHRDYDHSRRSRSPRYYCRSRSRSRSHSRSRASSYRRYRSTSYRMKSPIHVRPSYRTIRYDSLYKDEECSSSEKPKSTQVKVAELRDKRKKRDLFAEYVEKLEKEMAKTLKNYKKNPEKHPLYPEEWKKFWNRRYKELTAKGVDASKHDFKPEWIQFWLVRMKELHNEEMQMKKDKYKAEIGLIENDKSSGIDSDVIEVSPTPLEEDKSNVTEDDAKAEMKSSNEKSSEKVDPYESETMTDERPVRVITVLRLLTALESQLGSLGPRVNILLAQAIAWEKRKPNSSDRLIDIPENNVLFETVKEKLKGQLFAGIVEKHLVNATRTAIQNVAELFNRWKARKTNGEPVKSAAPTASAASAPTALPSEPLIVPGIGAVDKVAVAAQIAAALIAQGKVNVSEQELEQLINAVVGMAQATTRKTPTPPAAAIATTSTHQYVSHPAPCTSSLSPGAGSSAAHREPDPKATVLQHLVSSGSKSSWSSNTSLKVHAQDEMSSSSARKSTMEMNDLSEEDLKVLLQNFKDLPPDEQQNLIVYLKEMESKDPVGVEKLRQFVGSLNENAAKTESKAKDETTIATAGATASSTATATATTAAGGRLSPFSMREGGANPFIDDGSKAQGKDMDDDDDDYSYEEIYKAAEKKISGKSIVEKMIEEQQKKVKLPQINQGSPVADGNPSQETVRNSESHKSDDPECVLSEAKVMIANIMGQLPSKFSCGQSRTIGQSKSNTGSRSVPLALSSTTRSYSTQTGYEGTPSSSSANKAPNNLLNDYNYQDDIFGYSNDSFQNYSAAGEKYQADSNSSSQQRQTSSYATYPNPEPAYGNYESWNDNYSQYPPQQHGNNYSCTQSVPVSNSSMTKPSSVRYQGTSQANEYRGSPAYGSSYRNYY